MIYQYFAGKDELLVALIEESATVLTRLIDRAVAPYPDPLERLGAALTFMTDSRQHTDHAYNATMSRFVARTWITEPEQVGRARRQVTERLRRLIEAAGEAGSIEAGDTTNQAACLSLAVTAYSMNVHLGSATGVPAPPNLEFVRFALLGLGARIPPGWEDRLQLSDADAAHRRKTSERMAFASGPRRIRTRST